uniref:Ion_trans domain-containing protein n=1 Tax=Steinernema glaseri TaxID=37863 RepID=A0A1I8A3S1_9BILA
MLPRDVAALICLALSIACVGAQFSLGRSCFCKGPEGEAVDDCLCDGESSIDDLNNRRVFPILQRLLQKDFFRFYKVSWLLVILIALNTVG